jgi:hypothetical protein
MFYIYNIYVVSKQLIRFSSYVASYEIRYSVCNVVTMSAYAKTSRKTNKQINKSVQQVSLKFASPCIII